VLQHLLSGFADVKRCCDDGSYGAGSCAGYETVNEGGAMVAIIS
jgi:hypothetical protein